jgi:hypothetical protein
LLLSVHPAGQQQLLDFIESLIREQALTQVLDVIRMEFTVGLPMELGGIQGVGLLTRQWKSSSQIHGAS